MTKKRRKRKTTKHLKTFDLKQHFHKYIKKVNPRKAVKDMQTDLPKLVTPLVMLVGFATLFFLIILGMQIAVLNGYANKPATILLEFSDGNTVAIKFEKNISSRSPAVLTISSSTSTELSYDINFGKNTFTGNIGLQGNYPAILVNQFVDQGTTNLDIKICNSKNECETRHEEITIFDYNLQSIAQLFNQLIQLGLILMFGLFTWLELQKVKNITRVLFVFVVAFVLVPLVDFAPDFIWVIPLKFLLNTAFLITAISFLLIIIQLFTKEKAGTAIAISSLLLIWVMFVTREPVFAYLIFFVLLTLIVIIEGEKKQKNESLNPFNKPAKLTVLIAIGGILFSSFISQPIVEPIVIEKNNQNTIILDMANPNEQSLEEHLLQIKVKPALIDFPLLGTNEVRIYAGDTPIRHSFGGDCGYNLQQENSDFIFKISKSGIQECNLFLEYNSLSGSTSYQWNQYIDSKSERSPPFHEEIKTEDQNTWLNITVFTYRGGHNFERYRLLQYKPESNSILTVNGVIKNAEEKDGQYYVTVDLEPNTEYVIIQVISSKISESTYFTLDNELMELVRNSLKKYKS